MRLAHSRRIAYEPRPGATRRPDAVHRAACSTYINPVLITRKAIQERSHAHIRDAVHVQRVTLRRPHLLGEALIVVLRRGVERHGQMPIRHAVLRDRRRLVGQRVGVAVQPEVDDARHLKRRDLGELDLARLARSRQPAVDAPPSAYVGRVAYAASPSNWSRASRA